MMLHLSVVHFVFVGKGVLSYEHTKFHLSMYPQTSYGLFASGGGYTYCIDNAHITDG